MGRTDLPQVAGSVLSADLAQGSPACSTHVQDPGVAAVPGFCLNIAVCVGYVLLQGMSQGERHQSQPRAATAVPVEATLMGWHSEENGSFNMT